DCDGTVDNGASDLATWYADADSDSYGDAATTSVACDAPAGFVANTTDCDDSVATIHPGATETCNGVDDDCDNGQPGGGIDEGATGGGTYYRDADNDGHGNAAVTTTACAQPVGYVTVSDDCDDADGTKYPGNTEVCDGKDNDCNGTIDNGAGTTWYRDADGDGQGNAGTTQLACTQPAGYVNNSTDCEDNPAACGANCKVGGTEVCDGYNNDCDAQTDEGLGATWYRDGDGDGFGWAATTQLACTQPAGYVNNSSDCNDASASVKPGAPDQCNAVDDDCNPATPNGYGEAWFGRPCASGGAGACAVGIDDCVSNARQCRPLFGTLEEQCDGKDNDCNGVADNGCYFPVGCVVPYCELKN
ncbi:MAG: putative metal-binding motif-containing protein, partial [bacterium]|nr:putative metal-binding motif-containing protein [bacterium]